MSSASERILEMRGITKTFPGVTALDDVNLVVERGEIHALVGENGAGKSTLMKVLSGVHPHGSYTGDIVLDGEVQRFRSIADSERRGLVVVHQELALVPLLSIAENVFLGNEIATRGVVDWPATHAAARDLLARVGLDVAPATLVDDLGVGRQQLVEIAKALAKDVRLLILDEPTASLQERDADKLLDMLLEFRSQGITSILISHKLNEIARVADRVTVLRDGATVSSRDCRSGTVPEALIVRDMVGRDMAHRYPARERYGGDAAVDRSAGENVSDATSTGGAPAAGEALFEVRHWCVADAEHPERERVADVSFALRAGEVVGVAGLMGAGRTELAMSLFGRSWGASVRGEVRLRGEVADVSTVPRAIAAGLAYVTEDRKGLGLVLEDSVAHNLTLAALDAVARRGIVDEGREIGVAERYRTRLGIRTPSLAQHVVNLSGGNQQKVVLGKWLHTGPDVLILDEPTRGVDVGAKFEIYSIVNELAASGKAVLLISSEMPELLGMCDRILVMHEGRLVGELDAAAASQEAIMSMIVASGAGATDARGAQNGRERVAT